MGDFNLPKITWQYTEENVGSLTPSLGLANTEKKIVSVMTANGIFQMNHIANSRGAFLDLVLVTNISDEQIFLPQEEELIDNNSTHHNAIAIAVHTNNVQHLASPNA